MERRPRAGGPDRGPGSTDREHRNANYYRVRHRERQPSHDADDHAGHDFHVIANPGNVANDYCGAIRNEHTCSPAVRHPGHDSDAVADPGTVTNHYANVHGNEHACSLAVRHPGPGG